MPSIGIGISLALGAGGGGETPTYSVTIGSGPVITGTELTATVDGLSGGETVAYQWTDDGVNITGATASTYTVAIGTDGVADASLIGCVVTVNGTPYTAAAREVRYAEGTAPAVADGQTFTVDDTAVNIDGSATGANLTFSYALSGAPAGVVINSGTGAITGTPTAASTGTATITATDQYGRTLTDTWTWTASLRTQATATNLAAQSYTVDDDTISLDFASQFTVNGNTLTYTITGLPTGGIDDGDGTASGTPTVANQSGTITCTGTDEYGRETTSTATFTTALRTQATAAGLLGPFSFAQDEAITNQDLSADFTTNGNTLTYTVSPALPAGLSLASNGILSGTPTTLQTATSYTVTGQDEYGRDTDSTFTIAVEAGDFVQDRAGESILTRAGETISLRSSAAVGFTPADLFAAGEQGVWYDPSDLTTMWTDTAGTTQAGVGDAVARIDDKSGNGNNATQATAGQRPILRQDGAGKYYLEFDGVDDVMTFAAPLIGNISHTAVSGRISSPNGLIGQATKSVISFAERFGNYGGWAGQWTESTTPIGVDLVTYIYQVGGAANAAYIRINGVTEGENGVSNRGYETVDPPEIKLGDSYNGNVDAEVYQVIIREGDIGDGAERADLETYLADKAGITL